MEYTLLLGTNLGNRSENLHRALELLKTRCGREKQRSPVYETIAWGFEAPPFLNQAVVVESNLEPQQFLEKTQSIEQELGRREKTTEAGYTSREMDIDILFADNVVVNLPQLIIPHPRIAERRFVLEPLVDIVPDKVHPTLNKTMQELLDSCPDTSKVLLFLANFLMLVAVLNYTYP